MSRHVIVGAGPVGSGTACELAAAGHEVQLVSRRGTGPQRPGINLVRADAAQPEALASLAVGAAAIYNCANPAYHRWATDWPPIAASLLAAAQRSGAVLVTMSNLYGYGPVDHPMTETDPLVATFTNGRVRAAMWQEALQAHEAGRAVVTEARASDFFGPGVGAASHLGRAIPAILNRKTVRILGNPDAPHTWTYVPDVCRALVTLGTDSRAWGRAWHVPSGAPQSQREVIDRFAALAGLPAPRVKPVPQWAFHAAALASPMMRALRDVEYQFAAPFTMDSSAFTDTFGSIATDLEPALQATLAFERSTAAAA